MSDGSDASPDRARWRRLQEAFADVRDAAPAERERLLQERCGNDRELLREVRSLLDADAEDGALDVLAPRMRSVADVLDDSLPDQVGPYTIDGEIGRGGMGVVFRGHDPRLRRNVALKLVAGDLPAELAARQRFVNEARAASALDHPNICTIYDIGALPDGRTYLAMAYYGRGTLADRLKDGPLPVEDAVAIARQLADALDCAHEAGIVHRDVKPRNVAFGERGEARLLDFGVALLGHDPDASGPTAGTPGYMAPEQVRGERVDRRADVWGLGVVLFEMLCGRLPFVGNRADVMRAISEDDAPPVTALRPDVPAPLATIVARALHRDPAQRFATAADFERALRAAPVAPRSVRRLRAAALLVLVAAAGAAAYFIEPRGGPGAGDVALTADDVDYFLRGRDRYHAGPEELEAAITLLRSAVEHAPAHAPAHALLARAYARATLPDNSRHGQLAWIDSAEVHALRALALAPHLPDGPSALGSVARARGDRETALENHERALAIDPDYVYSIHEAAEIHEELQHADRAIRLRERALTLDPSLDEVRTQLVITYRRWELPDEAMRHIRAGLQLRPDNASMLWEATQLELLFGDTARARAFFNRYLPLLPAFERDRLSAWFEYIRGNYEAALPFVERVAPAASASFDLRMYGMVFSAVGDTAHGRPLLRRAAELARSLAETPAALPRNRHFMLAHIHAGLDERTEALLWLTSWEAAGGYRSWREIEREAGWRNVRDDPAFMQLVAKTDSSFRRQRNVIVETVNSLSHPRP